MAELEIACRYVSLSDYSWDIVPVDESKPRCHGIALPWNPTVIGLFIAFSAVTFWVSLEVNIQAMVTFRRWSTLYFWSIICTSWAVILYALTAVLMFLTNAGRSFFWKQIAYATAWLLTNSGFIAVLYSRLHLIIDAPRALQRLGWALIGIGIPFQVFLIVASTGTPFHMGLTMHNICYRLEIVITLVEIAMSGCYVYFFTIKFMRDSKSSGVGGTVTKDELRWTFVILIAGELFILLGDIAIIAVWLGGLFLLRLSIGPLVYALKLKVEFLILNRLTAMTQQRSELRHVATSTDIDTDNEATAGLGASTMPDGRCSAKPEHTQQINLVMDRSNSKEAHSLATVQHVNNKDGIVHEMQMNHDARIVHAWTSLERQESVDSMERQYLGRSKLGDRLVIA